MTRPSKRNPLPVGSWGFSGPKRSADSYLAWLEGQVRAKYGEISHEHRELINMAVRSELAARSIQAFTQSVLADETKEEVLLRMMTTSERQHIYFTKERLLAVRQLGLLSADVKSASGRDDEVDVFERGMED